MESVHTFFQKHTTVKQISFFLCLFLISLLAFWRSLSFGFFQDDYIFFWNALYHPFNQLFNFRHPGTPLEAVLFIRLFGLNPFVWGLLGIAIRAFSAYLTGFFLYRITNSKRVGVLAALFSAIAYAGMYSVNVMNFHITALIGICTLSSLIFLTNSLKTGKGFLQSVLLFVVGVILDPARGLSAFLLYPLLVCIFPKSKNKTKIFLLAKRAALVFLMIGIPLLTIWYFAFPIGDTQVSVFVRTLHTNPIAALKKTKDIGNYFATIANLFTYPFFEMNATKPLYETLDYQRLFGIGGILLFILGTASFMYGLKKKSQTFILCGFFILWTFLLYIPNFLAEPRRPMDAQHHYLTISAIGYISLVAYLLGKIKHKALFVLLSICFIGLNIYKVQTVLALEQPYRSYILIRQAMATIVSQVPKRQPNDVFFFRGDYDWLGNSITYFGGSHFLLLTKDANGENIPQFTFDGDLLFNQICFVHPRDAFGTEYKHVSLSHIYAWNAIAPGKLVNITQQERERLSKEVEDKNCKLITD